MLQIITIICVTRVQKKFRIRASIKAVIDKNITFFTKLTKFHIFANIVIFQVYLHFLDQLLHPYKWYGSGMSGILFFIFASCEPLRPIIRFCVNHGRKISKRSRFYTFLYNCRVQIKAYFSSSK